MLLGFFLKGALVGVIIAVPAGPVGVLCIRRTILQGRIAGFVSGLGAATADAIFGVIAVGGLSFVSELLLDYKNWLRLAGGAFLLLIGVRAIRAEPRGNDRAQADPETLLRDYASTFLLTIANPITIFAFLAVFAAIGFTGDQTTFVDAAVLVAGVWLGSLLWWAGLTGGAGWLRLSFERRHLVWISRSSGGILLLSGAILLGSLLTQHYRR
jgi:threonine/homoserine/homoserine lactone efflux protein